MPSRSPFKLKMGVRTELLRMDELYAECEEFLQRWEAYMQPEEKSPTDAIVALFELQDIILARRNELKGRFEHEDLPF